MFVTLPARGEPSFDRSLKKQRILIISDKIEGTTLWLRLIKKKQCSLVYCYDDLFKCSLAISNFGGLKKKRKVAHFSAIASVCLLLQDDNPTFFFVLLS